MGVLFNIKKRILEKEIEHEKKVNAKLEIKARKNAEIELLRERKDAQIEKLHQLKRGEIQKGVSNLSESEIKLLANAKKRHVEAKKKRQDTARRIGVGLSRSFRAGGRILRKL